MAKFTILDKKRKYFKARFESDVLFDLVIDANSENLELNKQLEMDLDDQSVRSKYGTKLIFAVSNVQSDFDEIENCYVIKPPFFNSLFVERAHEIRGKWIPEDKAWIFPSAAYDLAEKLDVELNTYAFYEVKFLETSKKLKGALEISGVEIAKATACDSKAKWARHAIVVTGECGSGGSRANWITYIEEGSIVRVPLLTHYAECEDYLKRKDQVEITLLGETVPADLLEFAQN